MATLWLWTVSPQPSLSSPRAVTSCAGKVSNLDFCLLALSYICGASRFDCADYMREPSDIAVGGREFYVCDFKVAFAMNSVLH